jgi:hypothetical protein
MKKSTLLFLTRLVMVPACAFAAPVSTTAPVALNADETAVFQQIQALNKIPEDQLDETAAPTLPILRKIIDLDGPEYLKVRKIAGQPAFRAPLTPGTRALLAELISPRWDAYNIAGSLWLAALRTPNKVLRDKARRKMVQFAQIIHVPSLINLLTDANAQQPAHEILEEITGQSLPPTRQAWMGWWAKNKATVDIVGTLLRSTRAQVSQHPIGSFEHERLWYVPDGIRDKDISFKNRSPQEQDLIQQWNAWAGTEVRGYIDSWSDIKPVIERVVHHPDPRVSQFLEQLLADRAYGDYAAIVLAWRQNVEVLDALRTSYSVQQTVGRALARGSLGDTDALVALLQMIDHSGPRALSYGIMEDQVRDHLSGLKSVGVLPAEEAFELLCHKNFGFSSAATGKEKRKRFEKATAWLKKNARNLIFDSRRGYFTVAPSAK